MIVPTKLEPDGTVYHYRDGDEFWVPEIVTGRGGIYKCIATTGDITTKITRNADGSWDTADFDSHIPADFALRTSATVVAGKINPWEPSPKTYVLGDEVYLRTPTVDYTAYYVCAESTLSQPVFSVWFDGEYPLNPNNQGPEYIFSGIHNPGFYLVPRGSLTNMQYVPKWPGMLYLCTDPDARAIYAYTDGKGPDYGWDPYAVAEQRETALVIGMIIGWLYDPDDANPKLPPGFLACNGKKYQINQHTALYGVVGDTYKKQDDEAGTFRVPTAYNQIIFEGAHNG
jgi:hypothetical protein